jgi:hypothetical protein
VLVVVCVEPGEVDVDVNKTKDVSLYTILSIAKVVVKLESFFVVVPSVFSGMVIDQPGVEFEGETGIGF